MIEIYIYIDRRFAGELVISNLCELVTYILCKIKICELVQVKFNSTRFGLIFGSNSWNLFLQERKRNGMFKVTKTGF
ncbi:hypothetical protein HanRHA438_Chr15g0696541 [Helianthus annuus]|nr:hypothetical protein HanRHA438_Chr15g0696541 [Helianthus annuus]